MAERPLTVLRRTRPESVLDDYMRLMDAAGLKSALDPSAPVIVKNNISWHLMFPGANTTPWQLEAVLAYLSDCGFTDVAVVENETVVTSARKGEQYNRYRAVYRKFNTKVLYNFNPAHMNWTVYTPQKPLEVLHKIMPHGIHIPDYFIGRNIVHLPTMKCHIYTEMTGSMKNAFGGLLDNRRHYCHSHIHQTLADLLSIQQEIHPGIFTVTDGTTSGSGPGPRTMTPVETDLILAGADCVAVDAVSSAVMGFDPLKEVPFIRYAHERGLGTGNLKDIDVQGESLGNFNYKFKVGDNLASRAGDLFWFGPFKFLQKLLFHTPVVYLFIIASALYHDRVWYPLFGRARVRRWLNHSKWGRLFQQTKE